MKSKEFLIGLVLGISIAVALSTFAWQDPTQNPPQGQGALYVNEQNLISNKSLWVQGNTLIIGNSGNPSGLQLYNNDGNAKCLTVNNNTIVVSDGNCNMDIY